MSRHTTSRSTMLQVLSVGMALLGLWIAYPVLNFTERERDQFKATLDRDYTPSMSTEVVMSMYKEPVHQVAQLITNLKSMPALAGAQYTIYIKDSEANGTHVKQETGASTVEILPNVGREGETYLNHILNRWDSLAKHTVFLQADIHNPREFYPRLNGYFDPARTGYLSLGWSGGVCSCEDCSDRMFWRDRLGLFPTIHYQVYNSTACDNVLLSYKGQFVVSAARIRGIHKTIYQDLWNTFVNKDSWAHKKEYLQGRPDSMSTPDFGYTMERMWNLLFQCSDMNVAWKCPTLLSGRRTGGSIEDCQCFDSVAQVS